MFHNGLNLTNASEGPVCTRNTLNIVEDTKFKTIEWFLELCMIGKCIICKYIWESGTYETVSSNNTSDWKSSDF